MFKEKLKIFLLIILCKFPVERAAFSQQNASLDLKALNEPLDFSEAYRIRATLANEIDDINKLLHEDMQYRGTYSDDNPTNIKSNYDASNPCQFNKNYGIRKQQGKFGYKNWLSQKEHDSHAWKRYDKTNRDGMPCINERLHDFKSFVGSSLFDNNVNSLSQEDKELLEVRMNFEYLIPKDLPECLFDRNMVDVLLQYFDFIEGTVKYAGKRCPRKTLTNAFYDALGGYLSYYVVPVAKYSYYAGSIDQNAFNSLENLLSKCKYILNTDGRGWRRPMRNPLRELRNVQIQPLPSPDVCEPDSCNKLALLNQGENDDDHGAMLVPLPFLDFEDRNGWLSNLWLPFKRTKRYNLRSQSSAMVLPNFYTTLICCYKKRELYPDLYNSRLKKWLEGNVMFHLDDSQFYPGLGGILPLYETLAQNQPFENNMDSDNLEEDNESYVNTETHTKKRHKNLTYRTFNKGIVGKEFLNSHNQLKDSWLKQIATDGQSKQVLQSGKTLSSFAKDPSRNTMQRKLKCTRRPLPKTCKPVVVEVYKPVKPAPKLATCRPKVILVEKPPTSKTKPTTSPTTSKTTSPSSFTNDCRGFKYAFYGTFGVLSVLIMIFLGFMAKVLWKFLRDRRLKKECYPPTQPESGKVPKKSRCSFWSCFNCRKKQPKYQSEAVKGKTKDKLDRGKPHDKALECSETSSSMLNCQSYKCVPVPSKRRRDKGHPHKKQLMGSESSGVSSSCEELLKQIDQKCKQKKPYFDQKQHHYPTVMHVNEKLSPCSSASQPPTPSSTPRNKPKSRCRSSKQHSGSQSEHGPENQAAFHARSSSPSNKTQKKSKATGKPQHSQSGYCKSSQKKINDSKARKQATTPQSSHPEQYDQTRCLSGSSQHPLNVVNDDTNAGTVQLESRGFENSWETFSSR